MTVNSDFDPALVGPEQPLNQLVTVHVTEARAAQAFTQELSGDFFSYEAFDRDKPSTEPPPKEGPPDKIHPVLATRLRERSPLARELVVLSLRDDLSIPRFPEPVVETRDSEANRAASIRSEALVSAIVERRRDSYTALSREFSE